jgi:hypothetical protein
MKKNILIIFCAVFALVAKAQTNSEDLKYLQGMFGMEKKQLVSDRMKISSADSEKFWKMYEEYELFRSEIAERRAENILQYINNFKSLSPEKVDEILTNTFEINDESGKLMQKTYKSMTKELSPLIAGQFYYVEMYVDALARVRMAEMLPHIGPAIPTQK